MKPSVLVTGSLGYIGSHLVPYLRERDEFVVYENDIREDGAPNFAHLYGCEFDVVVHLAAYASVTQSIRMSEEYMQNNAFSLIPFLQNNKIGKFIFASTGGAIYGNKFNAQEKNTEWAKILSPYGQSKYVAEKIIQNLHPNWVSLRLGNVHGGNTSRRPEPTVHERFRKDDPIVVYGSQIRDFVHMNIVCNVFYQAIKHNHVTGTYNIGSGIGTSIFDLALQFASDRVVEMEIKGARLGEVDYITLDITKAKRDGLL